MGSRIRPPASQLSGNCRLFPSMAGIHEFKPSSPAAMNLGCRSSEMLHSEARSRFNIGDPVDEEEQAIRTEHSDAPDWALDLSSKRPSYYWSTSWNRCGSCGSGRPPPFVSAKQRPFRL